MKPWRYEARVFTTNTESVTELLGFDQLIVQIAVEGLRTTASEITESYGLHVAVTKLNNRAAMLEKIREGGRLGEAYETIFNQCVVLLVAYFSSAVHGVFRQGLIAALRSDTGAPVTKQKLSVSWRSFEQAQGDHERIFADLLVAQKEISF